MEKEYCVMPEMPYCPGCKYGYTSYPSDVETYADTEGSSCEWVCTRTLKDHNKDLIAEFPYLQPRNVWTGQVPEDYDYSYIRGDCEIPEGWKNLFMQLCRDIKQPLIDANYLNKFMFSQIKEKYGTLRAYCFGAPEAVHNIINKYEHISQYVCQKCGKPARWVTTGWIASYCDDCVGDSKCYSENIEFNPTLKIECTGKNGAYMTEIDCSSEWYRLMKHYIKVEDPLQK